MVSTLCTISLEAFEAIVNRLTIQHLARMYMTGCPRLQSRLYKIRNRAFYGIAYDDDDKFVYSSLVSSLLAGAAARVNTEWSMIEKFNHLASSSPTNTSSIRALTIFDSDESTATPTAKTLNAVLAKLSHLETLNLTHVFVGDSLTFPPNLTSLSLHAMFNRNMSDNLLSLPLLHLDIAFDSMWTSSIEWMPTAAWYSTLTSLTLNGTCRDVAILASSLPKNLTTLELYSGGKDTNADLGFAVANLPLLETLEVGTNWHIRSNLPPKLTRLRVIHLVIDDDRGLRGVLDFIPATVTSLSLSVLQQETPLSDAHTLLQRLSNFTAFAARILPQLDLKSAIDVIQRFYRLSGVVVVGETPVELLMAQKLESAGLNRRHLKWLQQYNGTAHPSVDDHAVSELFKHGLDTRQDIAFFFAHTKFGMGGMHCACGDSHYDASIRCLAWGLSDHLTLRYVEPPPLSDVVLINLVKMNVTTKRLDSVRSFLGKYTFPSTRKLAFFHFPAKKDHQRDYLAQLIDIVCDCRANFPSLEEFDILRWSHWNLALGAEQVAKLATIRFHHVRHTSHFQYTTKLPVAVSANVDVQHT